MKLSAALVAVICLVHPSGAIAQGALEVGDRVRVRITGERSRIIGWVTAIEQDSLELELDDARAGPATAADPRLRIGVAELVNVERSVGAHRNTVRFGLAVGLVGGVYGALALGTCQGCYSEWALAGASVFGGVGYLLGAIVGSLTVTEEWQGVADPLGARPIAASVSGITPAMSVGRNGGVALTWSLGVGAEPLRSR